VRFANAIPNSITSFDSPIKSNRRLSNSHDLPRNFQANSPLLPPKKLTLCVASQVASQPLPIGSGFMVSFTPCSYHACFLQSLRIAFYPPILFP
jgi:hypothetical protein